MSEYVASGLEPADPGIAWAERDGVGRRAMLSEILAQVSIEALQGDTLDAVLKLIVDCIARRLPVTIASIILLDDEGIHFVQEVCAGHLDLELPGSLPWPVTVGAAGRCARLGTPQLIADVRADPDYVPGHSQVRAEFLVPIRHRARLHGVLNLESTRADFFTPEVCAAFEAVAGQIAGAIHVARVVGELEHANRRLQQLSMSDGLTGIANRRCFDQRLVEEWQRHSRDARPLAMLLVDVDAFKPLNDARGHLYGDQCLHALACLCSTSAPDTDALVARYGGDELALLLAGTELREARTIGERVRRGVESLALQHPRSPIAPHVTVSIGVAALQPQAGASPQALIAIADRALYVAKAKGRNRVVARTSRSPPPGA